jgi:hypothetical protein
MSNEVVPEDCWESHGFEGFFSIDLPFGVRPEYEDNGGTLTFPLPTEPRSELIAGVFPTPSNESVTPLVIRSEIERFMAQCVGVNNASFETPADFDKEGFIAYQAVAIDASGRCWIARLYGRRGGRTMLLVHWVGQESDVREYVLPVIVSIDPLLNEQDSAAQ